MAAMPRHSPGGHHILLWVAAGIGVMLAMGIAIALFRGLVGHVAQ